MKSVSVVAFSVSGRSALCASVWRATVRWQHFARTTECGAEWKISDTVLHVTRQVLLSLPSLLCHYHLSYVITNSGKYHYRSDCLPT